MGFRAMVLAMVLVAPIPVLAADAVEVRYEVFWGGFRAAEARLVHAGSDAELLVRATGMADSLAAFALEAESQHDQFRTHSRSKSMESTLAVDFHGTPHTIIDDIRQTDPEDRAEPRPPVPEDLKVGTLDPLTALVTASQRVLTAQAGQRFTVPIYDGRNRYDVAITIIGPGSTAQNDRRINGTRATITVKPLAGFRKSSQELWNDASFTLLLDPTTQLPARIVSDSFSVATVISAVPSVRKTKG